MFASLVDLLRTRAEADGDGIAFRFLLDGEELEAVHTYSDLDRDARSLAVRLAGSAEPGDRAVILTAPGPQFIVAFMACSYAGVIAVPAFLPDMMRVERSIPRLRAIAQDAEPACILTDELFIPFRDQLWATAPALATTPWVVVGDALQEDPEEWRDPNVGSDDVAFIQYTSGSTAVPKGVVLTHGNLLANSRILEAHMPGDDFYAVSWLPPYHDMGLIGGILQPLYRGRPVTLMSPLDFLARPVRWLRAMSRYAATVTGGPNFAYELCVRRVTPEQREGLDLSNWRSAINGAEPVRAETLARFDEAYGPYGWRPETMTPSYGLAEATLIVSGHGPDRTPLVTRFDADAMAAEGVARAAAANEPGEVLVACGEAEPSVDRRIVDPETRRQLPDGTIGEIWLAGPIVGAGYWGRRRESDQVFRAHLDTGEGPFLRTGDLGFVHEGELYIAGRIKDLIIIRGRNLHPQDIEQSVERVEGVRAGGVAAFHDGTSVESLAIVAEIDEARVGDHGAALIAVRETVAERHQVAPSTVVFIGPRTLAKTSSGKVQRHAVRRALEEGALEHLAAWSAVQTGRPSRGDHT